jgi:tetratricopeptide (TPR) repeat protein
MLITIALSMVAWQTWDASEEPSFRRCPEMRLWFISLVLVGSLAAQGIRIGEINLEGCRMTDPDKVLAAAKLRTGDPYDEAQVKNALMALGLFTKVQVSTEPMDGEQVRLTIKVEEQEMPTPKTEGAAKAINPIAVARRWVERTFEVFQGSFRFHDKRLFVAGVFGFEILEGMPPHRWFWRPFVERMVKAPWAEKVEKAAMTDDKALLEALLTELQQHLHRSPKDHRARYIYALLLMAAGRHEEAMKQVNTLMANAPDFHPVHVLRLDLSLLKLTANLVSGREGQFRQTSDAQFKLPPPDPTAPGAVKLAIEEGVAHFRRLNGKAWTPEALIAAAWFFTDAMLGEFLSTIYSGKVAAEVNDNGEASSQILKLTEPMTRFLGDYLRLSRLAERYPQNAAVHWAMANWGCILLHNSLFFGTLPHLINFVSQDDPEDIPEEGLQKAYAAGFRMTLQLLRPYFERWQKHLEQLIALSIPDRYEAYLLLAESHALLGDFVAARKTIETALAKTGRADMKMVEATMKVMGVQSLMEGGDKAAVKTVTAQYAAWLELLQRRTPTSTDLAFLLAYLRLQLATEWAEEWSWENLPPSTRQAILEPLRQVVQRNPKSDAAHRNLGLMLLAGGEIEAAFSALSRAYELNRKEWQNGYGMGLAYLAKGEVQKALPLLEHP